MLLRRVWIAITKTIIPAVALTGLLAHGQNVTWTGGDSSTSVNWSDAGNWDGVAPSSGESLYFGGTSGLLNTNDLSAANTYTGITFNAGAGAFVLSGNSIGLSGTLANASSSLQTINSAINLASNLSIDVGNYHSMVIGGGITGAHSVAIVDNGGLVFDGASTYTGTTTINGSNPASGLNFIGFSAQLNFAAAGAPTSNLLYNGVIPGALVIQNGTLQMTGAQSTSNSQTFGGFTVGTGSTSIAVTAGTSGSAVLNLGAIHASGAQASPLGMVNFQLPTGTQSATNGITTTTSNTSGIIELNGQADVTVNGTDWASNTAVSGKGNIVAYTGYVAAGASSLTSAANINDAQTTSTLAASTVINSLRFDPGSGSKTITFGSGSSGTLLTVSSGGILVPNSSNFQIDIISGGLLAGSTNGGLNLVVDSTGSQLQVQSQIVDKGSSNQVAVYGSGQVFLAGNNTYTGATTIQNGAGVIVSDDTGLGSQLTESALNLNGGRLETLGGAGMSINLGSANGNRAINLSGAGGTFSVYGTSYLSIYGAISGTGGLTQANTGELILGGKNTYTGDTTLLGANLFFESTVSGTQTSGTTANSTVVSVGSTTNLAVGQAVSGSGIAGGTYIVAVNSLNNSITLSAAATATGSVNLTFGYSGLGNGDVTVESSLVTLQGSGLINGSIILQSGSIKPYTGVLGDIQATGLTWEGGGTLQFKLADNETSDQFTLSGALTKSTLAGSTYEFDFSGTGNGTYDLMTFGSTNFSASDFSAKGVNGVFDISGDTLQFTVVPVPEASDCLLLFIGLIVLLGVHRNRRSMV